MKRIFVLCALLAASASQAATQAVVKGDPAKAQPIVEQVCAQCHAVDGNSAVAANPRLAAQPEAYLYKQLHDFKTGKRKNPVMNGFAAPLSEADMRNLAAWYAGQAAKPGKATDAKLAEAGGKLYRGGNKSTGMPACMACHSPSGAGIPAQFPRLAGQHAAYVAAQLKAYRSGERGADGDVNAAMMRAVAAKLSDADIDALAQYVSGLK